MAPIFDGRGELVGALDISSIDPTLSEHSHALAGALVIESSRAIEERCFREQFRRHWIVAAALPDVMGGAMLFAVDRDYRIVGADLNARVLLLRIQAVGDVGVSFWTLFERDDRSFRGKDYGCDITVRLVPAGSTEASPALITPPEAPAVNWPNADSTRFHCRPRLNILASVQRTAMLPRSRGGLSPKVFRRVQEYIDAHINENIDLEVLAAIAGLSVHHFARAFRKSAGLPPHGYVMHRRLDKARDLLICTDRALADIALAAGFSDQSHLARHFQQSFGVSPRIFRYSYR